MAGSVQDNTHLHNWYYRWSIVSSVNSCPAACCGALYYLRIIRDISFDKTT